MLWDNPLISFFSHLQKDKLVISIFTKTKKGGDYKIHFAAI